jgi:hypothetical protein
MENREFPEKSRLEEMQEVIDNASESIEAEFKRTANPWLSCFGSRVFAVETYLSSPKTKALISPEKYELAEKRMEDLKQELYDLKQEYPDKDTVPPEEIQQELLRELDILREGE